VSYNSIWTSIADVALSGRITAAIAQEVEPGQNPYAWLTSVQWLVVTAGDIEAAYAYALGAGTPDPGGDETVITDGMILSSVQAALAVLPTPAGGPVPP
jgi:hypothetical protein